MRTNNRFMNVLKISLLTMVLTGLVLLAQRGGPARRLENPQTIQLPSGSRVEFKKFYTAALGKETDYSIFLPFSYDEQPSRKFPVIYFLHGINNNHTSWTVARYGNIPERIERLTLDEKVVPFLMVHPNGENSFYTNHLDKTQMYEEYIWKDMVNEIEKSFRAKTDRQNRSIAGTSMGGYGALKIAIKHSELYACAAASSPIVLLGEDPSKLFVNSPYRWTQSFAHRFSSIFGQPLDREHWKRNSLEVLAQTADFKDLDIYFAYGTADRYNRAFPMEAGVRRFDRILTERGIPHLFRVFDGEPHGWGLVAPHLEETLAFLCHRFK